MISSGVSPSGTTNTMAGPKSTFTTKQLRFGASSSLRKKNTGFREEYENVAFLYVSDDMAWGKKNIKNKKKDLVRLLPFHLISFFDSRVNCGKQDS